MSKFRSSFRQAKPIVDVSSNVQFPGLSSVKIDTSQQPSWNYEKSNRFSDKAKYFDNGDVYEGDVDELGLPSYGKMTFANGNVYEGPIRDYWIKDEDEDEDEDDEDEIIINENIDENDYDEYDDYEEELPIEKYGKMTYANGEVFWGVFCFAQRNKWN